MTVLHLTTATDQVTVRRGDRYRVLLGALIIQLILGTVYGYSIFWQPLQSELGLTPSLANYAFAICILSFAVTMVIAGRLQDVAGPRIPALIGAVLMGAGFLVAAFVRSNLVFYIAHAAFVGAMALILLMIYHTVAARWARTDLPILRSAPLAITAFAITTGVLLGQQYVGRLGELDQVFVLWGTLGFLAGAGIGFGYVCPIAALVKWFPRQKGLVAGIAVAGFGLGAYFFSNKNLPFSAENFIRSHGITTLFLIHGLVCLLAVTAGALLLRNPPTAGPASASRAAGESDWQQTLRRPAFYTLWIMFFSGAMAGLMVIGILKPFAGQQLLDAAMLRGPLDDSAKADLLARGAAAVGWLAIFNAVGRVVWGLISDRIGRTVTFVVMFAMQAAILFVLGMLNTELSLAVGASLVGFNYGGIFALFPSATADLFGSRNLGANYGWLFTSYGIAGVAGIMLWNEVAKHTSSPTIAFYIAASLCLLSAALAIGLELAIRRQRLAPRPA